jgi:site-specific recombinase XerD
MAQPELPQSLNDAFAEFLEIDVANGDATEDTVRAYRDQVRMFVLWCGETRRDPARLTRRDIEAYREDLKRRGNVVTTRSHKLSIVRRFYEAAVKHGLVEANPAQRVKGGKDLTPPEEKIKALTREGLAALLRVVPSTTESGKRDRAIIALMAVHGLRRVEVHRLDHDSIQEAQSGLSLEVHGKGNRIRRVYLREDTVTVIEQYVRAKMENGLPLSGALFLAHGNRTRGARLSRRAINDIVDHYLGAASLKRAGVSCHALRHTHGTLAVAGGAKIEQLREAMGHSHIETTGIYVRAVERAKHNPANFIDVDVRALEE